METLKQNSLDLIEECLDSIYKCRKSALLARSRKYKQKEERKAVHTFVYNNPNSRVHASTFEREYNLDESESENGDDEENNRMVKELSLKFSAPPPPNENQKSQVYSEESLKGLNIGGDSSTDECNHIAESAFSDFSLEITTWLSNHSKDVVSDDDLRAEFADHLVHRYLSCNLDRLPSSRRVSEIRRLIATTVEEFVSNSAVNLSVTTLKQRNGMAKDRAQDGTAAAEKEGRTTAVEQTSKSTLTTRKELTGPPKGNVAGVVVPPADDEKRRAEQRQIKRRYEEFMHLRRQTEGHPDNHTLQQRAELNDDIQNLLTSIQQGGKT